MRTFAELPISIKKGNLSPDESDVIFDEEFYSSCVAENRRSLMAHLTAGESRFDADFLEYVYTHTRANGALDIHALLEAQGHSTFLNQPDRLSRSCTHSRGYSYLVSRDAGLTAAEKLAIYARDLFDALNCISSCGSRVEAFIISDYLKNALITMLNALVTDEKVGLFALDDPEYQRQRFDLIDIASIATEFHYQFFFKNRDVTLPSDFVSRAEKAVSYLQTKSGKRWARLHAASLSRPEASHPWVIFSAALVIVSAHPSVQTIVGLPSGGTELAFLIRMHYDFLYGFTPRTIFLPMSFHSVKEVYGERAIDKNGLTSFLRHCNLDLHGRKILICDDNASTAKTLQQTHDALQPFVGTGKIVCAVAEIDIIRSLLDRKNPRREYVANPTLFAHSINILPVSRRLRPKTDIKELMERREIIHHHKQHRLGTTDEIESIYREIMIDVNKHDTTEVIELSAPESLIKNIQGTILSNFYAIPIRYKGLIYPSVEHAYQHQKFTSSTLEEVASDTLEEIREAMRLRGFGAPIIDLNSFFTDDRFNAGNIKILADILRKNGYGKEKWADARVKTMIALLLVKFSDRKMAELLVATGTRTIIEGNNWDDTLWGYCDGRGRNLLGRILMNIRSRKSDEELLRLSAS